MSYEVETNYTQGYELAIRDETLYRNLIQLNQEQNLVAIEAIKAGYSLTILREYDQISIPIGDSPHSIKFNSPFKKLLE